MNTLRIALLAVALTVLAGVPGLTQSGQDLFQQALVNEQADGDLRAAIAIYQRIVREFPGDRVLAAKALVQMGKCHEKLGQAEASEARKAYERVVREFGDQPAMAAEARARLTALTGVPAVPGSPTLTVRRVLAGTDVTGKVSADGRFLSFTDWGSTGNVAIRDLATGQTKPLTDMGNLGGSGGWAEPSMPSPDGKRVAYTWNSGGGRYLCVVGLDGSKPQVLRAAGDGILDLLPVAWSPDNTHLLAEFVWDNGTRDMMLVAVADGSSKLLKAIGKDLSPGGEFSPDGRYIAWATSDGLSLFDLQSGTESPLLSDRSSHGVLGWAPDGRHILFSSERAGSADAWLVAVSGGKAQGEPVLVRRDWGNLPMGFTSSGAFYYAVINNVWEVQIAELGHAGGTVVSPSQRAFRRGNTRSPDWSPDGRSLAAVDARASSRAVIVRSMDTGEEREFPVGERTIGMGDLRWTPDGRAVAVPASEPGKGESLIRIDLQTAQVTSLMSLPALGGWPRFAFSPAGDVLFYLRPPVPFVAHTVRLVAHDLRSGQETEIVQKPGLLWGALSPDGQRLAINTVSDQSWSLLVTPASGGEFRELVRVDKQRETPFGGSPSWASDGRSIVFLKRAKEDYPRQWQVWRVAVTGGKPERIGLIAARQLVGLRLHPDGRRVAMSDIRVNLEVWVMENFLPPAERRAP